MVEGVTAEFPPAYPLLLGNIHMLVLLACGWMEARDRQTEEDSRTGGQTDI